VGHEKTRIIWFYARSKSARKEQPTKLWGVIMAVKRSINGKTVVIESTPKKTRQGAGKNTKCAASSRNVAKKRYRGQGK
jgi:hypothetical protein